MCETGCLSGHRNVCSSHRTTSRCVCPLIILYKSNNNNESCNINTFLNSWINNTIFILVSGIPVWAILLIQGVITTFYTTVVGLLF